MATKHWARYLRNVQIQFCPRTATPSSVTFLSDITATKVKTAVPALQVSKTLINDTGNPDKPAPQLLKLGFVDGYEEIIDASTHNCREIYALIGVQNGRLDLEALKRGKPW
uniref:Uncharacterized protein n=1 Tax=Chrysotila carterae TaxID=13221 RepID=A0A7S4BZV0_CHRCT|mmetsp:Transcript_25281/g.49017  ORF Transcript_25281/g.49017 Transcript_25281/m.49017 type:complete len:111 (+) Transcript_25281:179-511(+)|eukprot:1689492-Pleurochrysis_carterae.AAC.1